MLERKSNVLPIAGQDDVVRVRQAVRAQATEIGLSLIDQTKIVTAASEIARNTLEYGGGGTATIEVVRRNDTRPGIRVVFEDHGPGIADIERALSDGFTTGNGLGLGLGGARRLSSEFEIYSELGKGTRISITRWK
ncbi:MAG TPA: anti-sigma regulatory factor [Terriglobia bacterium]|nr:anti-sigma regulatory factor [Terriglobia bacterium]